MIVCTPSQDTLSKANQIAKIQGNLKNSITNGERNSQGVLGELAVKKYLGINADIKGTKDYDFIYNGKKIEVKTMGTNYNPNDTYICSINKNSAFQDCDIYVFCFLNLKTNKLFIYGWCTKKYFYENCYYQPKGEPVRGLEKGLKEDQYRLKVTNLNKMKELKEIQ